MKKLLLIALLALSVNGFVNNDKSTYEEIKKKLDNKEITLKEAQILWLKYKKRND